MAKVRALLPGDWSGRAGDKFRQTAEAISDFAKSDAARLKTEEALDLSWKKFEGIASKEHAEAMARYADEENKRIDAVLKKRTLESKARKAEAEARITEAEAGLKEVALMQARIALVERLREQGLVPISDEKGSMRIVKAPSDFNWEALQSQRSE